MKTLLVAASTALSLAHEVLSSRLTGHSNIISFQPADVTTDSVHNIHVSYNDDAFEGPLCVVFGSCDMAAQHQRHHEVGSTYIHRVSRPERLIWIVPEDSLHAGCLHAFSGPSLIGRSAPINVKRNMRKREDISDVADVTGPWFDGVAYMQSKNNNASFVAQQKSKKIGIVGGGMSGLFTILLLDSVGIHNWHITESSQRIGGRIRTKYLNGTTPDQYQYQEMGPMRFPVSVEYADTNETLDIQDHKMVFQLGDTLNRLNGNKSELAVKFIPWIQYSPNTPANSNGYRLPNGRIPSAAQIAANSSLQLPPAKPANPEEAELASKKVEEFINLTPEKSRSVATNIYKAHKKAIEDGLFHWSEAAYIKYALNMSQDTADFVGDSGNNGPLWFYDNVYFSATTWRTIDKGLESLPRAFYPLVKDRLTLGRKIDGLVHDAKTNKISLTWRDDPFTTESQSEAYDYAIIATPFTKVRLWNLPQYSSLLSRAISSMNYEQACKVALHYKTRFWEHLDPPIIGGCGIVDIPGVSSVCYPSYAINSSLPGVLLASYTTGTLARSLAALSTADHIGMMQRAMIEAHGAIAAEQYTGNFERQCWEVDEHQAGAWAAPFAGQQDLYLPAYYKTEFQTVFVGEHTSYTHAWIFSALDSAVRGTVQVLLDMGLVDEAKEIVETWMARWIHI